MMETALDIRVVEHGPRSSTEIFLSSRNVLVSSDRVGTDPDGSATMGGTYDLNAVQTQVAI